MPSWVVFVGPFEYCCAFGLAELARTLTASSSSRAGGLEPSL